MSKTSPALLALSSLQADGHLERANVRPRWLHFSSITSAETQEGGPPEVAADLSGIGRWGRIAEVLVLSVRWGPPILQYRPIRVEANCLCFKVFIPSIYYHNFVTFMAYNRIKSSLYVM